MSDMSGTRQIWTWVDVLSACERQPMWWPTIRGFADGSSARHSEWPTRRALSE